MEADRPGIACFLGFHAWGAWVDKSVPQSVTAASISDIGIGQRFESTIERTGVQVRRCARCNIAEWRYVRGH